MSSIAKAHDVSTTYNISGNVLNQSIVMQGLVSGLNNIRVYILLGQSSWEDDLTMPLLQCFE